MIEPHPLRCETCIFHKDDEELTACEIRKEWMPEEVWNWLQIVGCASHSANTSAEKVLENLKYKAERERDEKVWEARYGWEQEKIKEYYRGYLDALTELRERER